MVYGPTSIPEVDMSNLVNPVNKSRLHEEIVLQIQNRIIKGELAVGEKLPSERELANSLNVNRATLREALKKLELLGLIDIKHGDGIYVKNYLESGHIELIKGLLSTDNKINVDVLKSIFDIRKIVMPEMAKEAASMRTDKDLQRFVDCIEDEDISVLEKDLMIHHLIARASKNILSNFILNFFNDLFRTYAGGLYFDDEKNREMSTNFHKEIYEAIKTGNKEEAFRITYETMVHTENVIYDSEVLKSISQRLYNEELEI